MTSATSHLAAGFVRTALTVLQTSYPYGAAHVSRHAGDTDVTPARLHPAFHGALDWHSSVHMQWSLVQLLRHERAALEVAGLLPAVVDLLDARLTSEHAAVEAAYLAERPSFERPYGWAWALQLAAATTAGGPETAAWARALEPLTALLADRVVDWLGRQAHPVRHGVHSNSAFALSLVIDAGGDLGRPELVEAARSRALDWFGADTDADTRIEPSGTDFLSPALCTADLMSRVLDAEGYRRWLDDFLPGLGAGGHSSLLTVPQVLDATDGQFVHLWGLALSRCAHLRRLAAALPVDDPRRATLEESAAAQFAGALPAVTAGDFMATHWLVSFALLALGPVGGPTPPD